MFKQIKHKAKYVQGLAVLFTTPTLILKTYLKSINIISSIIIKEYKTAAENEISAHNKTSEHIKSAHVYSLQIHSSRKQFSELLDSHVPEV